MKDKNSIAVMAIGAAIFFTILFMMGPSFAFDAIHEVSYFIKGKVYCITIQSTNVDLSGKHCFRWDGREESDSE